MKLSEHMGKDTLHHAYFIEGERDEALFALRELLRGWGVELSGNPDYHEYLHDALLVDHARELKREQGMHAVGGGKKYFVICFNSIIDVSQHALLKTLEEPTRGTHFFFISRSRSSLFPTLLSRMQVLSREVLLGGENEKRGERDEKSPEALSARFLESDIPTRMKIIEPMTKAKKDNKSEAKEEARVFLSALEQTLVKILRSGNLDVASTLENILKAKQELGGRAPSVKLLLEHLAFTTRTGESMSKK